MESDPQKPELLARVRSEVEAVAIFEALKTAGIECEKVGGFTAGFIAEAPGDFQLLVHENDLAQAKQVLADLREHGSEVDWSQVDVGQPEDE